VDIRYFYQNNQHSYKHETIINSFAKIASTIIDLPPILEVCLYDLGKNVYGGIDMIHINRIGINYDVPFDMMPKVLLHELIHVNQKHTGILRIARNGTCYWHGIAVTNKSPSDMTYEEYQSLPWEVDVENRLPELLKSVVKCLPTR
jgi:hypothetical protein